MLGLNQLALTGLRGGGTPAVVATNLLQYSEEFQTFWTQSGVAITADSGVAPDGTTTADTVSRTSNAIVDALYQQRAFSAQPYTLSIYAKAGGSNFLYLFWADNVTDHGTYFDLSNGSVGNTVGTAVTSSSIQPIGAGWYRCAITFTATAGSTYPALLPSTSNASGRSGGSGSSNNILIWGAQLETGTVANGYVKTT